MHWYLIYWIVVGTTGSFGGISPATAVVEFDDETSCHNAYTAMRNTKAKDEQGIWGVCVRKSSLKD